MGKRLQKITVWIYPCEGKQFYRSRKLESEGSYFEAWHTELLIMKKWQLLQDECTCGKKCKPQKIYITVEVA